MSKGFSEIKFEGELFYDFRDNNNTDSLGKLVNDLSPWLMRIILRITGNIQTAEDILQDTWIRMVERKGQFDIKKGSFRYYILTIAKNEALKWKKKETGRQEKMRLFSEMAQTVDKEDPSIIRERDEKAETIRNALREIKQEYQNVIILYYFDERKVNEIADLLNKPSGTIKTWLDRGRTQLEKKLSKKYKLDRQL